MADQQKTVSLVLTSGSARGMAHIGAIEEIEKRGYKVKAVSGASIGAVVGGVYAAGKMPEYKEWMLQLSRMDVFNLFDFSFSSKGVLKGEKVFDEMKRIVGDYQIEELPIPFTAIATDIIKQKEVWLRKGSLMKAIRASVAIPTIVHPVYTDDQILIDGGVTNPIPVGPILQYESDIVIVVNLNANIPYTPPLVKAPEDQESESQYMSYLAAFRKRWASYFSGNDNNEKKEVEVSAPTKVKKLGYMSLMNHTITLMEDRLIELTINDHRPDVIVEVSRNVCGMFEFYKAKEVIEAGRLAAIEALDAYEAKQNKQ